MQKKKIEMETQIILILIHSSVFYLSPFQRLNICFDWAMTNETEQKTKSITFQKKYESIWKSIQRILLRIQTVHRQLTTITFIYLTKSTP